MLDRILNWGYRDRVLCDVIHIDAFHLLIGNPLHDDLNAQHDGKKNTYTIINNDESFTFNPLPYERVDKQVGSSVMW